jgi:MFS family permease
MKNFLTKIYTFKFFDDFILIYPLYAVMFINFGMEPWQIATLLAIWSATSFLVEIPSGVWADKYSRKNILFIGQVIRAIGYLIWLIFPTFWGFLIGFVLWGIKGALTSGTYQALIYDELKLFKREKDFTKVLGRSRTLAYVAMLSASGLASLAIFWGYDFVLAMSSISVLISGVVVFLLPKTQKVESTHEKEYFTLLKKGLRNATKNPTVFRIILFMALAYALGGALDEYWPIFANGAGLQTYWLGIFIGVMSGVQAIASFVSHKFENRTDNFFYSLLFLNGAILLTAGYLFSVPSLLLLIVFTFLFTIIQIVFEGRLQHAIPSETRATVSSVSGFFGEIGVILVYFSFGTIAQTSDYKNSFLIYGVFIALLGLWYLLFVKNR